MDMEKKQGELLREVWNGDPDSLRLQKNEMEEIQFFHIDRLKELLENPAGRRTFVPHGDDYYSWILTSLSKRLGESNQLSID